MNAPVIIYLAVATFTLVMSVWAIATALVGDPEQRGSRFVTGCCTVGLLALTPCVGLAAAIGHPRLIWGSALLPLLILGVTWSNVTTLRGASVPARVIGAPTVIYNLLLIGIYSSWFATECTGLDLGTWTAALLAGFAQMQTLIGHPSASESPMWLYLPIILPVWPVLRGLDFLALIFSSIVAAFLVFALMIVMPLSVKRAESYRETPPPGTTCTKTIGLQVPWGDHVLSETTRSRIRIRLQQLGVQMVTFHVSSTTSTDGALRSQLVEEVQWARSLNMGTVAITQPPRRFAKTPAASIDELRAEMTAAQTFVASELRPDCLVLYSGPFGRLRRLVRTPGSPLDWYRTIRDTARGIRAVNKDTSLAVSFDRLDVECEGLFRLLDVGTSPVDAIGVAVMTRGRLLEDVLADLERFEGWCDESAGARPVLITECHFPIQLLGGELAQSNLTAHLLAFAERMGVVKSVSLHPLWSPRRNTGLISWSGRTRTAYRLLEEVRRSRVARPGR